MPAERQITLTTFARHSAGADVSVIAERAVAIWKDVGVALSPIIGQSGVDALFKRSLHLSRSEHPCLDAVLENKLQAKPLNALHAVLVQQTSAAAMAANITLLHNFQDLLASLIGLSLSERLLHPVWDKPSSGQAVQDTTS